MGQLGFCVQAEEVGQVDALTPTLAVLHDDFQQPQQPFAGKRVVVWRLMTSHSNYGLEGGHFPPGSVVQIFNEFDDQGDPWWGPDGWARSYIPQFRAKNPGVLVAYGGPPPTQFMYGDGEVLAMCDLCIVHIGVNPDGSYWPTPADLYTGGKPCLIGEVEAPPPGDDNHAAALAQLVPAAIKAAADYNAPYAFLWGSSMTLADAVLNAEGNDFRAQVSAYNAGQSVPVIPTSGDAGVASPPDNFTLQRQNGLNAQGEYDLAQALLAVIAGDKAKAISLLFDGPASTFGQLNAISNEGFPVPSRPS